mmetsp:Transcript_15675/g.36751  ORF Transcript_15675/g.36751 Transcript_15675/m.36751 type:complete len:223 (+) Transcript_15675:134-802(+)
MESSADGVEARMAQLSVRNTFLHFDLSEHDASRTRAAPRARSMPAGDVTSAAPLIPPQEASLPSERRSDAGFESAAEVFPHSQVRGVVEEEEADGDAPTVELILDPSEWSEGSKLHGTGECKPCAWHWKSSGCEGGRTCEFCHICGQDELKLRRRRRVRELRKFSGIGSGGTISDTASSISVGSSRSSRSSRRGGGALRGVVPLPPGPVIREHLEEFACSPT